jgi:hypothetical protein
MSEKQTIIQTRKLMENNAMLTKADKGNTSIIIKTSTMIRQSAEKINKIKIELNCHAWWLTIIIH